MRISTKGRYALAAVTAIARTAEDSISLAQLSNSLGISKLYLEQVFSLLRKSGLVASIKGPHGGYRCNSTPSKLTLWEILSSVENGLLDPSEPTVPDSSPDIEVALNSVVFGPLDEAVRGFLESVTVQDLLNEADSQLSEQAYMQNM
ncbi:MAG: Rrf2 family transcriptional regulator [Oscillospiraceae bacterium]|jgi:Rrf2 family protein|nr:Rrf2 family transcriptional regulator [Oscillospiraceae bacterium]